MLLYVELGAAFLCLVVQLFVDQRIIEWFAWLGLSICSTAALWEFGKGRGWVRRERYVTCAILVGLFVLATFFLPFGRDDMEVRIATEVVKRLRLATSEPPFHVEIPHVFRGAQFAIGHGNVASPVDIALHLQVSNPHNAASKIAGYTVQVAAASDGPWKSLLRIPTRGGELYWFPTGDLAHAMVMKIPHDDDLATVLSIRPIEPSDTVEGWDFYERMDIKPDEMRFFRFDIRDTAGRKTTQIVPIPSNKENAETNFQNASLKMSNPSLDIRKMQFKYFHSSYPD